MKAARVGHLCTVQYLVSQGNFSTIYVLLQATHSINFAMKSMHYCIQFITTTHRAWDKGAEFDKGYSLKQK